MWEIIPIPAFKDNYIWLVSEPGSQRCALVDPGEAEPALQALTSLGRDLSAILITHHHGDHTGGVAQLLRHFEVPVYGPAHEPIPTVSQPLKEGDQGEMAGRSQPLRVLDVPAHTRGHIAYVGEGVLFPGDTLFTAGSGRLFEGNAEQMLQAMEKFRALDPDTLVYCAHEYTLDNLQFALQVEPDNTDIKERQREAVKLRNAGVPTVPAPLRLERATNPFLRYDVAAVRAATEAYWGRGFTDQAGLLGGIRDWKDAVDA